MISFDPTRQIPQVETSRLLLRGFRPEDTETFIDEMTRGFREKAEDPKIALTRQVAAWRVLSMVAGGWLLEGHGYWAVVEKGSGAVIGRIGSFAPRHWPDFEIGWEIFESHRRLGFATEGVSAALLWFHDAVGISTFTFRIPIGNIPSESLARSIGAVLLPSGDAVRGDTQTWKLSWEDFEASGPYRAHVRSA